MQCLSIHVLYDKTRQDLTFGADGSQRSALWNEPHPAHPALGASTLRMSAEYVYALHDFLPQNDDEIDFEAGERIEVIEKDDLYGDGWWTVSISNSVPIIGMLANGWNNRGAI